MFGDLGPRRTIDLLCEKEVGLINTDSFEENLAVLTLVLLNEVNEG